MYLFQATKGPVTIDVGWSGLISGCFVCEAVLTFGRYEPVDITETHKRSIRTKNASAVKVFVQDMVKKYGSLTDNDLLEMLK